VTENAASGRRVLDAVSLHGVAGERPSAVASVGVDLDGVVAELFAQEGRSLVRLARLFCDDRNAAEDLVQEAFIRLHRSAHTIRDRQRAPAFLRSIVLNLARDHNRRGLMSLRHQQANRAVGPTEGVEEDAIAEGDDRVVIEALRSLPARQRECLVLRFYAQMTEREIAEIIGISPNSVKTHCQRGLRSLESKLEDPR
jgi:RNA polymerase sigma-70 factor (sigma-E family)